MSKRNYTHIKLIEAEIIAMREAGKSRREIAEHFGLEKEQIKWWINRYNRKQKKLEEGIVPRPKGRPRKDEQPRDVVAETDISYIHTGQGILCLSVIRDLFDNSIVAHKTGTSQSVNLVLDTIRLAMQKEKKVAAELQLHSDQGSQYTSQAYFDLTKEYGIIPSMSRRGNCYDNAMAENFFSILKTECIYRHQAATFDEANKLIDNYIYFYNYQRIQLKTGVAPLTLRHSA